MLSLSEEAVVEALAEGSEAAEPLLVDDTAPTLPSLSKLASLRTVPSARSRERPAPVSSLLPPTLASWEAERQDFDDVDFDDVDPVDDVDDGSVEVRQAPRPPEAQTRPSAQFVEMFVDPTSSVEESAGRHQRRRAQRRAPIDPVVFEVTDRTRAQLERVASDEDDVWA